MESAGLWVVGGVVVAYTLFGGFLAASITGFVQGLIMVTTLVMVPLITKNTGFIGKTYFRFAPEVLL